jgi:hypothetical protein
MSDRRHRNDPVLNKRRNPAGDRRRAPRYETNGVPASVGWYDGTDYRTTPARLIDISLGGLSAWTQALPTVGASAWFRLGEEDTSPWVEAVVVEAAAVKVSRLFWARSRPRVRLRFVASCPYDTFKTAIEGFAREADYTDPFFDGVDRRTWR